MCAACRPCRFFEKYLTLTDDYAGQPFILMPWQRDTLRDIFGTLDDDGLRVYRDVYLEVTKKNSKSTWVAGICLFVLIGQGRMSQKIYGGATTRDQAGEVFRKAAQMVKQSPELSAKLRVYDSLTGPKQIHRRDDPESFYSTISADGDKNDGFNPAAAIRDELHRWRTRKELELAEIMERSAIARQEPLLIDITTSGESPDESPLAWRRHEYTRQINEGLFIDRQFYGRIWAADETRIRKEPDYWKSKEARVLANPSHEDNGGYLKDAVLEALCNKAQNDPRAKSDYLRYHLGIWNQSEERVIDIDRWQECGGGIDFRTWPAYDAEFAIEKWGLTERLCFAGVDASWTTDLTAVSFVFPPLDDEDSWTILPFFWMPKGQMAERERVDKVPYGLWVKGGWIEATDGDSVDLRAIKEKIRWASRIFDLREVDFDPYNFRTTASELMDEGFDCMKIQQGYQNLSEPTKKLLDIYLNPKKLRHGNHPVLNWNASCLSLQNDRHDNVMPSKPERSKSSKRIDGIQAMITAMVQALYMDSNTISYSKLHTTAG